MPARPNDRQVGQAAIAMTINLRKFSNLHFRKSLAVPFLFEISAFLAVSDDCNLFFLALLDQLACYLRARYVRGTKFEILTVIDK